MKGLSSEQKDKIKALALQGLSASALAERFSVSTSYMYKVLNELGVSTKAVARQLMAARREPARVKAVPPVKLPLPDPVWCNQCDRRVRRATAEACRSQFCSIQSVPA